VSDINYTLVESSDEGLDDISYPEADLRMNQLVGPGKFATGCALGLVMDGSVVYLKGYGLADKESGISWDVRTPSAVGSVSKTFTALALLRLAESTSLDLTDPLDAHVSPESELGEETLEAALLHTSGIGGSTKDEAFAPSWGPGPDDDDYPVEHPMAHPRYAYEAYSPYELYDPPEGTTEGYPNGIYSNVGYSAIGAVIDSVAPGGYERYVWHEVGRGLHLTDGSKTMALGHSWRENDIPHFAQGYEGGVPVEMWDGVGSVEGWEGPSGGWTMTIGDLARFVAAVQRREIVGEASWTAATDPKSWVSGGPYGYGMWVEPVLNYPGAFELWHGGDIKGYSALWASFEGIDDHPPLGVAMQCNQMGSDTLQSTAVDLFWLYVSDLLVPELFLGSLPSDAPEERYELGFERATIGGVPLGQYLQDGFELVVRSDVRSSRVEIASPLGSFPIEKAKLGGTLLDLRVNGLVDLRGLEGLDVCVQAKSVGLRCEPCSDRRASCVSIDVRGLEAIRNPAEP
jgi:CubicO group peptidase (beta-lactamase class C family)